MPCPFKQHTLYIPLIRLHFQQPMCHSHHQSPPLKPSHSSYCSLPDISLSLCLCFSVCLCLSASMSLCLSICLSLALSLHVSLSLPVCISLTVSVSLCMSVYVSVSDCLSVSLFRFVAEFVNKLVPCAWLSNCSLEVWRLRSFSSLKSCFILSELFALHGSPSERLRLTEGPQILKY